MEAETIRKKNTIWSTQLGSGEAKRRKANYLTAAYCLANEIATLKSNTEIRAESPHQAQARVSCAETRAMRGIIKCANVTNPTLRSGQVVLMC